jgi:predicted TIM-barrel fold metal-dependent hydrolase
MSEKIHFRRFIRQRPLQLGDLPTQDQLAGSRIRRVYFFESIAPVVKQSSRYPKLSRKPEYVVAALHFLESLASKFVMIEMCGVDRVLFETDFGPVPMNPKVHIDLVDDTITDAADRNKIFSTNARALLRLAESASRLAHRVA